MKTTTVLVAGATGLLGNEIIKRLSTVQESLTGLMLCAASGDRIDMKEVLDKFPIELASVGNFENSLFKAQPFNVE